MLTTPNLPRFAALRALLPFCTDRLVRAAIAASKTGFELHGRCRLPARYRRRFAAAAVEDVDGTRHSSRVDLLACWPCAAGGAAPGAAGRRAARWSQCAALDQRVATIGYRLAVASRDLCAAPENLPGFAVHDLSQYGADFRPAASPGVRPRRRAGRARAGARRAGRAGRAAPRRHPAEPRRPARCRTAIRAATGASTGWPQILDALDAAFADGSRRRSRSAAPARALALHVGTRAGLREPLPADPVAAASTPRRTAATSR